MDASWLRGVRSWYNDMDYIAAMELFRTSIDYVSDDGDDRRGRGAARDSYLDEFLLGPSPIRSDRDRRIELGCPLHIHFQLYLVSDGAANPATLPLNARHCNTGPVGGRRYV